PTALWPHRVHGVPMPAPRERLGASSRGRTLFERRVEHRRDGVPGRRLAAMDLPPGPRAPAAWQTVAWTMRPAAFLRVVHDRFGDPVTIRTYWTDEAMVLFSSPDAVREVFLLDPAIAPAGQSWEFLRPFAGPHSILVLDGEEHLRERRLIQTPFHGERMRGLSPPVAAPPP